MKVEELRLSLTADDMHIVFIVPSSMCQDPTGVYNYVPEAGCQPLDMFNSIEIIDLELVMRWSEYLSAAGKSTLLKTYFGPAQKSK